MDILIPNRDFKHHKGENMEVEIRGLEDSIEKIVKRCIVNQSREMEVSLRREIRKEADDQAFNRGASWSTGENEAFKREWIELIGIIAKRHGRSVNGITSRYTQLRKAGWNPYYS